MFPCEVCEVFKRTCFVEYQRTSILCLQVILLIKGAVMILLNHDPEAVAKGVF